MAVKNKQDEESQEADNVIGDEPVYDETEVNGKFRIISEHWTDNLNDPESEDYKKMEATITRGIEELLQEDGLTEQADFKVTIVGFK